MLLILLLLFETSLSSETFTGCGDDCSATLSNGVLTVKGSGSMADYNQFERPPWWDVRNDVTQIKISDGFTTIGNCAFEEFSKVVEVDIPASVETIAISAFCGCTSLKTCCRWRGYQDDQPKCISRMRQP